MKTEQYENHQFKRPSRSFMALAGLSFMLVASTLMASMAVGSGASFNNVQVFVTTSAQLPYTFTTSAYNLTGFLVASYQGTYPAAAFELPTGDYLFTVSAMHQTYTPCYACAVPLNGVATASGTASAFPVKYYQPASEYGYQVVHIDSSTSLNIQTKNVTTFPTTNVTVKVSFVNGTAAAGAWVSASVVGQWYYWWGQNSGVVMSAQTGADGVANLVLPVAPAVVTAWDWVPVNLPKNETTIVVNVGGQNVNVTVYWQPTYVGLSASTLLIPPANSANLTLHYQQPSYWYLPTGVGYAQGSQGGATIANQPSGVPSQISQVSQASTQSGQSGQGQFYLPSQIPAIQAQAASSGSSGLSTSGGPSLAWAVAAAVVAVFATVGIALVVQGRSKRPSEAVV